jgi:NAD(P)-dependent dehydrogenase (short-subunit alcohol dehydrogenase family)
MIGMTKTIARGYAEQGILAFAVAPGFTVSEMTEEYLTGRGDHDGREKLNEHSWLR